MIFAAIDSALNKHYLDNFADINTAFENIDFTPDKSKVWAAVFCIPNNPVPVTNGSEGQDEHTGVYQIDINHPANTGKGKTLALADKIAAKFKAGTKPTYDGVTVVIRTCGIGRGRIVDGLYRISISINWYARATR